MRVVVLLLSLLVLTMLSHRAHAAESYAGCTGFVPSLPYTISTPGIWCLNKTLNTQATSGISLTIASDNVTLDCNGFAISGNNKLRTGLMTAIYGKDRHITTVRHCTVFSFDKGLDLQSTGAGGGHVVEDNNVYSMTMFGLRVEGDGSVVRHNLVSRVGASNSTNPTGTTWGIYTVGSVNLSDNTVDGIIARQGSNGSAYGIYTWKNPDGTIEGNRVHNLYASGTGNIFGIANIASGRVSVLDNDLFDYTHIGTGVSCADSSGRLKGNIINGFALAVLRCGKAKDNDISP